MIDVQKVLVTDHISQLERDAGIARARTLPALEGHGTADREPVRERVSLAAVSSGPSVRMRLGHWLVGVGEAIAGSTAGPDDGPSSMARAA